jgi:16S rRNA G966 N2-methylase RsmD
MITSRFGITDPGINHLPEVVLRDYDSGINDLQEVVLHDCETGIDNPGIDDTGVGNTGIDHPQEVVLHDYDSGMNKPQEVVLPGYEAGINDPGIDHSQSKLKASAERLFAKLAEFRCSPSPSSSQPEELSPGSRFPNHRSLVGGGMNGRIQTFHCRNEEETWTYRCRCNFQIVRITSDGAIVTTTSSSASASYRYAMRSMGKPVFLGSKNSFPIATRRIQTAMSEFMEHLNESQDREDLIGHSGHLTSCTFSSAWRDDPDADCVLTLHYDYPLDGSTNAKTKWKQQAQLLCRKMRLRQLNGRSKGILLSVKGGEIFKNENDVCGNDNGGDEAEATIRDTIFLLQSCYEESGNQNDCPAIKEDWSVSLDNNVHSTFAIPVHYEKPETAFYHPNPNAMTTALAWMLNRLASIRSSSLPSASSPTGKLNLLEMYCGCGAHTVALGRSGLVSSILAVELDPRLVRACEANVARNSLQDLVEVRRGDAGRWAREESRKRRSSRRRHLASGNEADGETSSNKDNYYDVLLVDPPRQGLDEEVCRMAMMTIDGDVGESGEGDSCFRNLLYVSCGHRALLRDLERLAPVYEVANCAQMDLFPRTDSIETLVHLRRRKL